MVVCQFELPVPAKLRAPDASSDIPAVPSIRTWESAEGGRSADDLRLPVMLGGTLEDKSLPPKSASLETTHTLCSDCSNVQHSATKFSIRSKLCRRHSHGNYLGKELSHTLDMLRSHLEDMSPTLRGAIENHAITGQKLYSVTEDTLPLRQLLDKYDTPWHWRFKGICLCTLALFMVVFISWSLFKVIRADQYMEIHREETYWTESSSLPKVAIANVRLKRNYSLKINHVAIRDGTYSTRVDTPINHHECDVKIGSSAKRGLFEKAHCLPDNVTVSGIYGDALFQYVAIDFYLPKADNLTDGSVSLVLEDKPTLFSSVFFSHYYTFVGNQWTGVEVFFKKIVALRGESLGAFGHTGNDETENYLPRWEYLKYDYEYTRASTAKEYTSLHDVYPNDVYRRVFTVYLRAGLTETEEFYEVYSLLKALEKAGGLWTSLALLSSLALVLVFSMHRRIHKCFTGRQLKLDNKSTDSFEPDVLPYDL